MRDARVLIVDDDPVNLRLMEAMLRREGFSVSKAINGAEALDCVQKEKPDLVLLDAIMPEMDGYSVLKRLRAIPRCTGLPVIMVTGLSMDEAGSLGREVRADAYMEKPVDRSAMLKTIRTLLNRNDQ